MELSDAIEHGSHALFAGQLFHFRAHPGQLRFRIRQQSLRGIAIGEHQREFLAVMVRAQTPIAGPLA